MICCAAGNVGSDGEEWGSNVLPPTDAVPLPDTQPSVAAVLHPGSSAQPGVTAAAVLKPDYAAALDRHNTYRQRHQVRASDPQPEVPRVVCRQCCDIKTHVPQYIANGIQCLWGAYKAVDTSIKHACTRAHAVFCFAAFVWSIHSPAFKAALSACFPATTGRPVLVRRLCVQMLPGTPACLG